MVTLMLYRFVSTSISGMPETVALPIPIIVRYLMLVEDPVFSGGIKECSDSEIEKHPVSGSR